MEDFPDFNLFPRLTRVAQFLGKLLPMHLLSERSDHEFKHPFDEMYTGEPTQEVPIVERGVDY